MSKFEEIKEALAEANPCAYLFDGLEDGLIGFAQQFGRPVVACYDYDKCVKVFVDRDGMTEDEAIEFFEFNTVGLGLGDNTPIIMTQFSP